ncbi:MAG: short chain dehydrogenase [Deltaproteobacteria bacterium CG_4_9_14_3_um_filter_63_12]|nr:MAG: short chain dehydrogenase [Deltaproteobacteria bacterium CG17_big_fil_post_rev_8_21_14_2_50_63_7]PJB35459.1 MAG: short chain dehydrogenase [Deltaproteobacteria bacterium CG_4_9_14_3_um_filter_63_12]
MSKRDFDGKVVWITGASAGLGRAMALEFGKRGAKLALSARRTGRLDELVAELATLDAEAIAVACDVTDEAAVAAAVAKTVEHFGRLDVAVANAGFGVVGKIEKLTADDWRRQFDTNVVGAAITAKHALPALRESKGRMVLIASVAGMIASPGSGPYSASKYALRAIGQTLSMEVHGTGVTCTTIHPGFVATEIARVDNKGIYDASRRDPRPKKLMWESDRAATVIVNAVQKRKREYTFTMYGKVGAFAGRHMPGLVHFAVTRSGTKARKPKV